MPISSICRTATSYCLQLRASKQAPIEQQVWTAISPKRCASRFAAYQCNTCYVCCACAVITSRIGVSLYVGFQVEPRGAGIFGSMNGPDCEPTAGSRKDRPLFTAVYPGREEARVCVRSYFFAATMAAQELRTPSTGHDRGGIGMVLSPIANLS